MREFADYILMGIIGSLIYLTIKIAKKYDLT